MPGHIMNTGDGLSKYMRQEEWQMTTTANGSYDCQCNTGLRNDL